MKLSVVIPCYNESDGIPKLKSELLPILTDLIAREDTSQVNKPGQVEVVLVDDGSRDTTWGDLHAAFENMQIKGIQFRFEQHEVNRGLGAAIRTGLQAATGDIIVTTDSDGTYKFESIPALLEKLTPEVSLVTASPYHPDGGVEGVPEYRLFFSKGASFLYRIFVDWHIHTYTALYRAYRKEIAERVTFEANDFLGGTELMVKALLMGYRAAELPAVLHQRQYGESKAKIARTIRSHLGFLWRVFLHRLSIIRLVESRTVVGE